ncbi:aldolase [Cohnella soli]|uniref:Aldolase n=1 Tax=Cohnella soli TaxID=425005 RepID=A0ABW0I0J0_9BACL
MNETTPKFEYKAFGLLVSSDIPLPELPRQALGGEAADIEVRIDSDAMGAYEERLRNAPYMHFVEGQDVMFYVPDNAMFRVSGGNVIRISPDAGSDGDLSRLYVLGTCMCAILMQRQIFPLHGSAVVIEGKAYAIVGESGAGKSTLASALMNEGFPLLSDDLIAVTLKEDRSALIVTPSFPQQKLWEESLNQFGLSAADYPSIYGRETKFSVPVADRFYVNPVPLAGVFELVKVGEDEKASIEPIGKLDRLQTLYTHTFRQFLIQRLGLMNWHFSLSAAIAEQTTMHRICRPEYRYTTPELIAMISEAAASGRQ